MRRMTKEEEQEQTRDKPRVNVSSPNFKLHSQEAEIAAWTPELQQGGQSPAKIMVSNIQRITCFCP